MGARAAREAFAWVLVRGRGGDVETVPHAQVGLPSVPDMFPSVLSPVGPGVTPALGGGGGGGMAWAGLRPSLGECLSDCIPGAGSR